MDIGDYQVRFGGIQRLYGDTAFHLFKELHIGVIGIGGVGSWAVEALARSGIGHITLIDHDDIALTNTNRQLHTLNDTIGRPKVEVMAERVTQINRECRLTVIDDLVTATTFERYLNGSYDYIIDAIDGAKFKAAMIHYCSRHRIPIITTGGAGGQTDPTRIQVADLSRTYNDPLAARVRSLLRSRYGFSRDPRHRFRVECVFSSEPLLYPGPNGTVSHARPGGHGATLDCRLGYGSVSFVTAPFGFVAAARAINQAVSRRMRSQQP